MATVSVATPTGPKVIASNVFFPFWKFMGILFVWFLFTEALKKIGLINDGKKK